MEDDIVDGIAAGEIAGNEGASHQTPVGVKAGQRLRCAFIGDKKIKK